MVASQSTWHGLLVAASLPDSDEAKYSFIPRQNFRQSVVDGLDLKLRPPSRNVEIRLSHGGTPVAGANVRARTSHQTVDAVSDDRGVAILSIYDDGEVHQLAAWTDDLVGGFSTHRKPKRDSKASLYECELHQSRHQTLRVVDEKGQPVPTIALQVEIATPPPNFNYLGKLPSGDQVTDENGEIIHKQFPDWQDHHCYLEILDPSWAKVDDLVWNDGVATQVVRRTASRKAASGRLIGDVVAGLMVKASSFQHPQRNRVDVRYCISEIDGSFTFDALPGATYATHIEDPIWVSDVKHWIPAPESGDSTYPEISVGRGHSVTAILTSGEESEPIRDVQVRFRTEYRFSWLEDGRERTGVTGPRITRDTDENGQATAMVSPGKLKVSVYTREWSDNVQIDVSGREEAVVRLHRPFAAPQTVVGTLISTEESAVDLTGARVQAGAIDGKSDQTVETSADSDGRFHFETSATYFGVYAETQDRRYSGVAKSRNPAQPIEVTLLPTMGLRGRLLNQSGNPIANHKISTTVRVEGPREYDQLFVTSFTVREISVRTDSEGVFVFEKLPAKLPLVISTYSPHDPDRWNVLDHVFLEPGEDRPPLEGRIDDEAVELAASQQRLQERFESVLRDCLINGYRLMIIRHSGDEASTNYTQRYLTRYRHLKDIAKFMPVLITGTEPMNEVDTAYARRMNWPAAETGEILIAVHDHTGVEIDRLTVGVDAEDSEKLSSSFIVKHAPETVEAEEKWDEAFASAKRTGRRVWAIKGGRYCGPCIRLLRWIDDHADLIAKDFVVFKVDAFLDNGGTAIGERITRGGSHGVPFHAIFDSDERLLVDSEGPTGNIGMPSSYEGRLHFQSMLNATRRNLTPNEVENLLVSLWKVKK